MAKNQGVNGERKSQVIRDLPRACSDELAACEFIERQRWGGVPKCPTCQSTNVYKMADATTGQRNARFLWRCKGCKRQYTVRVGMFMEDSKIPLRHWCFAIWAACGSKKGVSAKQVQRQTGLSYESALFMMHRIRHAMADDYAQPVKLTGTVEVDETYVGGKPRGGIDGNATRKDRKTPVFALVQRNGSVRAMPVKRVNAATLWPIIRANVDRSATLMSDESGAYPGLGSWFAGGHHTVTHSRKEYARGNVHSNTVEGFFSLLKRGVYGTYHSVSKHHLHRYVSEFAYRWNTRTVDDGERVRRVIVKGVGKRLLYKEPA